MDQGKRPSALRPFLFGVFGFTMAAAVLGAVFFLWPSLIPSGSTGTGQATTSTGSSVPVEQVATMQAVIDHLRYLLGGLALGLTGIVVIQTVFQARHDRVQHQGVEQISSVMGVVKQTLEARLEEDRIQQSGVQKVSEVMAVVKDTLVARLDAEKAEREKADSLQATIGAIKHELDLATRRREVQDRIIMREREEIESKANLLASNTSRHQFRDRIAELESLARQFDTFRNQSEPMEEPPRAFSARVLYIRGIAALYDNDPEQALSCLTTVTQMTGGTELPATINRRIANAFYYLGVTQSNFGNLTAATDSFAVAISKVPEAGDYLTRVVFAEALAMGDGEQANRAVAMAQEIVDDIGRQQALRPLRPAEHRLRSRATLIQANVAILTTGRPALGPIVDGLLRPLLREDPDYYYAIMTLAQTQEREVAVDLYRRAYDGILRSNHLFVVTETRSKILLHMAAALCLLRGMDDVRHAEEQLDSARGLLLKLPRIDSAPSTVFSVLTKRNEPSATILQHIRDIQGGVDLIPGGAELTSM